MKEDLYNDEKPVQEMMGLTFTHFRGCFNGSVLFVEGELNDIADALADSVLRYWDDGISGEESKMAMSAFSVMQIAVCRCMVRNDYFYDQMQNLFEVVRMMRCENERTGKMARA